MDAIEKTISQLEEAKKWVEGLESSSELGEMRKGTALAAITDGLVVLKDMVPRVMTADEVWEKAESYICWLEERDKAGRALACLVSRHGQMGETQKSVELDYFGIEESESFMMSDYTYKWRLWSREPSMQDMATEAWPYEIKRCPFCGGEARVHGATGFGLSWVKCDQCDASTSAAYTLKKTVELWNQRWEE